MSSQEEYLDQLLKDMLDGDRAGQEPLGRFDAVFSDDEGGNEKKERYDLDDLQHLSIDDINQILEENAKGIPKPQELENLDLDALVARSNEEGIHEIQDMLAKADRNEAVDDCIVYLIEKAEEAGDEVPEDILDQMQEEKERVSTQDKAGIFGKFLGKKGKPKNSFARKRSEDFEFENIDLANDMELIDGDEKNKGFLDRIKDRFKNVRKDKERGKEYNKEHNKEALKGKKKDKRSKNKNENDDIDRLIAEAEEDASSKAKEHNNNELDEIIEDLWTADETGAEEEDTWTAEEGQVDGWINETPDQQPDSEDQGASWAAEVDENKSAGENSIPENPLSSEGEQLLGNQPEGGIAFDQPGLEEIREKGSETVPKPEGGNDVAGDLLEGIENLGEAVAAENLNDLLDIADLKEKPAPDKKKGLFAKLIEFLTEEDEEEQKDGEGLILSDENDAILKELDQEKGKKKKKKPKKGKDKDKEEGDEEKDDDKKGKKKEKKPKKKKEPKLKEVEEPGKKLSKRRVTLIFLVCIAIGGAFFVLSNVTVDFSEKKKATEAFMAGDYEECYQNLVGKKLSENEQVMFGKSESILRIRLWMKEYEMLANQGLEPEALDSLIQSVHDYPTLYAFSGKWNAVSEVQAVFDQMLEILKNKYGLTEEEAKIIAAEEDDLAYSKMIRTIAGGGAFGDWENQTGQEEFDYGEPSGETPGDEDLLPEEEDMQEVPFVDSL